MNIFWFLLAYFRLIQRDFSFYSQNSAVNQQVNNWTSNGWTIHQIFDKVASANPEKPAIRFQDETWSFKQLQEYSLRVANYFRNGYSKGDVVALLMMNGPEYVGLWLGLSRIGVVAALLNTRKMNTDKQDSLGEMNGAVLFGQEPKALIISPQFQRLIKYTEFITKYALPTRMQKFVVARNRPNRIEKGISYLDLSTEKALLQPIDDKIVKSLDMSSTMAIIHSYGTDNNHQKTYIDFKRFVFMSTAINKMLGVRHDDILYNPIPMYQSYVSLVGTGQMLLFGNTMVIKKTFVRNDYFSDCKLYEVTVALYSGEMTTQIYTMNPSHTDKDHKVRMMLGSGMGRLLWNDFQTRFNIKQIGEFYGSIEGNTYLINTSNQEGAAGFMPRYVKGIHPVDLVDYDPDTGAPLRGKDGLCVRTKSRGLLIARLDEMSKSENTDDKTKQNGIIEDVFKKGDIYLTSGDIFETDDYGYFYLMDHVKNIFRFNNEDISVSQVTNILVKEFNLNSNDVVVYGVKVGKAEGRAAMVTLAINDNQLDKAHLIEVFQTKLSTYQTPKFLRITDKIPKNVFGEADKQELENNGFDPAKGKNTDILYYYKGNGNKPYYDRLTAEVFRTFETGNTLF